MCSPVSKVPVYVGETKRNMGSRKIKLPDKRSMMDRKKLRRRKKIPYRTIENGVIKLYNREQLKAVGSDGKSEQGHKETFGQGERLY